MNSRKHASEVLETEEFMNLMHIPPLTEKSLLHHSGFLAFEDLEIISQKIAKVIFYFRKLEYNKSQDCDLLHLGVNFAGF